MNEKTTEIYRSFISLLTLLVEQLEEETEDD